MKYNRQKFCDMTSEKKLDLIKRELNLKTHNAITKDDLLMFADWLYWRVVKDDLKVEDKVLEEEGLAPYCPNCGSGEYLHNEDRNGNDYCGQCGTKLDWSDVEDNYDSINYGFVPKVKMAEEDKRIGNVTFKKGVHIYFCGHCNQGILPSWKHCEHCGEKIVWKDKRNIK